MDYPTTWQIPVCYMKIIKNNKEKKKELAKI